MRYMFFRVVHAGAAALMALAALGASLAPGHAQEVRPTLGDREGAYVASTPGFMFHSDFWFNLHDYLYWLAQEDGPAGEGTGCLRGLPEAEARGWQEARAFYQENMGQRHHRRDPLMREVRYTLADLGAEAESDSLAAVLDVLRGAASAYGACFWAAHDVRNRERIGNLISYLVVLAPDLEVLLSAYYQDPWPDAIPVDVVSYSDFAGANTASGANSPAHTTVSSTKPSTEGLSGMELLLHEATHLMFGARHGTIAEQIRSVSDSLGVAPPRNLWHAISFYTSGVVVERVAARVGEPEYESYAVRSGLWRRAWPHYLPSIERYWQPYLDGEVDVRTSLSRIISAVSAGGG